MKQITGHLSLLAFCGLLMVLTVFLASCGSDNIIKVFEDTATVMDTGSPIDPPKEAIGGYLKYSLSQIACPTCFNGATEVDVRMESLFHLPIMSSWTTALPERGNCVADYNRVYPTDLAQVSVGTQIDFAGGWSNGIMQSQGIVSPSSYRYTTGYMDEANYNRDTTHDIYLTDNRVLIEDAFTSIHGFDYIEPYELLWIDPSYAFAATLFRSGMSFSWGPYGSDDDFMIMIATYNPTSGVYLGNIACMGADSGNMHIPAEYASKLPSGALASVHFQRHKVGKFAFDHFPSYDFSVSIETHMFWEAVGTGYIE